MTASIDDLIRYEPESTALDFKGVQYVKAKHADLLKDVMAMANAHVEGDRHIICGVSKSAGGNVSIPGLCSNEVVDAASYQQLVESNIEPHVDLSYFPHEYAGKTVAILRISNCSKRPYTMRKDFDRLERGEAWIRKGTMQMLLQRDDLEKIYESRRLRSGFSGKVTVAFDGLARAEPLVINARAFELPSVRARREILDVLAVRQLTGITPMAVPLLRPPGSFVPYIELSTRTLHERLQKVERDYEDYDLYYLSVRHAAALNFRLVNTSDEFVEDARFEVAIPRAAGVVVSDAEHYEPIHDWKGMRIGNSAGRLGYPEVQYEKQFVYVSRNLGNLRHRVPTDAFDSPVRVCFREQCAGKTIELRWSIHGKNLRAPLSGTLAISVRAEPIQGVDSGEE